MAVLSWRHPGVPRLLFAEQQVVYLSERLTVGRVLLHTGVDLEAADLE